MRQAIVLGVANKASIAAAIVEALAFKKEHDRIIAVYQTDKAEPHVAYLRDVPGVEIVRCDVTDATEVQQLVATVAREGGNVDLVHSIAFAPAASLSCPTHDVTVADFATAMQVSVHSLLDIVGRLHAEPRIALGRVVTISYIGAVRAVRGYGIMGVCKAALESAVRYLAQELAPCTTVNAISCGPIRTRAAGGIPKFDQIANETVKRTPGFTSLACDVADMAAFLLGDTSASITGQTLYVDGGFSING